MQPTALPAPYCKACRAQTLARYPGWTAPVAADAIVYLHDDLVVSTDPARLHVVFQDPSAAWRTFAASELDLRSTVLKTRAAHRRSIAVSATTVNGI